MHQQINTPLRHATTDASIACAVRQSPPSIDDGQTPILREPERKHSWVRAAPRAKIGFITPNLLIGGVEQWLLGLLRHTSEQLEWRVAVTNLSAVEPPIRAEVEAYADAEIGDEAVRQLCGWADIIISWGVADLPDRIRGFGGPVVLVSHGCGPWTESFLASAQSVATHFVAVSSVAAGAFRGTVVTVIPNGVDEQRCRAVQPREHVRQQWGLAPHEIAVGFLGRLSWEKNPLAIARAVRVLGPGYRAVYVGKGYADDYSGAIRNIAPDAVLAPPMHQVGDALHAFDCLIVPSPAEGFSMALVEALAVGLPVVTTPVGIAPTLMLDDCLDLVTVSFDAKPEEMARAVRQSLAPDRRAMVQRAKDVVLRKYVAKVMAERWLDYLVHAVAR